MKKALIVGSGLFGATVAHILSEDGWQVDVVESRSHIGGNLYCQDILGIPIHVYGPHIFHTNSYRIWQFIRKFVSIKNGNFINRPMVVTDGYGIVPLPISMPAMHAVLGARTPAQAMDQIDNETNGYSGGDSVEAWCLANIGHSLYEAIIKNYTEKQWGDSCANLPASIVKRLPIRFTWDTNYYNARYQGVPKYGYNFLIEGLLEKARTIETNYYFNRNMNNSYYDVVVYTGPIDKLFDYEHGHLGYRSLRFEHKTDVICNNIQGVAQMNYSTKAVEFTRSIEHSHFYEDKWNHSVLTDEYPQDYDPGNKYSEPYYPIRTKDNEKLYYKYMEIVDKHFGNKFFVGGRLGSYKYLDMDQTIGAAFSTADKILGVK